MNKRQARKDGYARGFSIAMYCDLPKLGSADNYDNETVDASNFLDYCIQAAYESESIDRDFSPFEFTAHAFNSCHNSESLWASFDAGISAGIHAGFRRRFILYAIVSGKRPRSFAVALRRFIKSMS